MGQDKDDVDGDGDTEEKVPAYVKKGDGKKKKKKSGKVPPQFQKHVKEETELKDLIRQQIKIALEEIKNEPQT